MLAESTHPFKVNFCKYTNETRLAQPRGREPAQRAEGDLCAINAACAGGGYELALACDEIHLVDDNNSAVSLPEVPLLGVLPGTGGLTRLVDKRKVRRDRADVFCTMAEGMRGKKAVAWGLVDAIWPKSQFAEKVQARAKELAASCRSQGRQGHRAGADPRKVDGGQVQLPHVQVEIDARRAQGDLTVHGPKGPAEERRRLRGRRLLGLGAAVLPRARRRAAAAALRPRGRRPARAADARRSRGAAAGREGPVREPRTGSATRSCADGAHAAPLRPDGALRCTRSSTPTPAAPARSSS
jgi:benzoyl-CoA-dihydrodiol lyase